jgi:hypothetical protein
MEEAAHPLHGGGTFPVSSPSPQPDADMTRANPAWRSPAFLSLPSPPPPSSPPLPPPVTSSKPWATEPAAVMPGCQHRNAPWAPELGRCPNCAAAWTPVLTSELQFIAGHRFFFRSLWGVSPEVVPEEDWELADTSVDRTVRTFDCLNTRAVLGKSTLPGFDFFFPVVLGFELRTLHLLHGHSPLEPQPYFALGFRWGLALFSPNWP